jgi:hypothetical protein
MQGISVYDDEYRNISPDTNKDVTYKVTYGLKCQEKK